VDKLRGESERKEKKEEELEFELRGKRQGELKGPL